MLVPAVIRFEDGLVELFERLVTARGYRPETVRDQFKAWCTRKLKAVHTTRTCFWTEGGSRRWLNTEDDLAAAIVYVMEAQDAVEQLLESLKLNRREIARFKAAGERFAQLEQAAEAERAFTSIVEALPLEAESHSLLAEVRESQNRWLDAIAHWQRAAEYRSLEPEPLLRLAAAQIHERQNRDADITLHKLEAKAWEPRFGDISGRTHELRKRLTP